MFVFFKQKTAYELRISDWMSDVCASDLGAARATRGADGEVRLRPGGPCRQGARPRADRAAARPADRFRRRIARTARAHLHVDHRPAAAETGAGAQRARDRKSVVEGKGVSVRVDLGGRRNLKKKKTKRRKNL